MQMTRLMAVVGIVGAMSVAHGANVGRAHGPWVAIKSVDKMTDAVTCSVRHTKDPFVSYDPVGRLDISFRTRGGVAAYQWRIDDLAAVPLQIAPDSNNMEVSVADFRSEFKTARRLRVQVTTLLRRAFDLEYDLRGLMDARADALRLCGMADPAP